MLGGVDVVCPAAVLITWHARAGVAQQRHHHGLPVTLESAACSVVCQERQHSCPLLDYTVSCTYNLAFERPWHQHRLGVDGSQQPSSSTVAPAAICTTSSDQQPPQCPHSRCQAPSGIKTRRPVQAIQRGVKPRRFLANQRREEAKAKSRRFAHPALT